MPLAKIADLGGDPEEVAYCIEVAQSLSTLYDEFMNNFDEGDDHRSPGIHASEVNKCLRQAAYTIRATEKRKDIAASWQKRFQIGHAVHAMVQEHFKRMCIRRSKEIAANLASRHGWLVEFEAEVKCAPGKQELASYYNIHSSCDGVFTFTEPGTSEVMLRVALEIKTEAPDSYKDLKKPKDDHVAQAHLYMACLDIPVIWFFYFNKGNQNNTDSSSPWLVVWQPEVWKRLEDRIKRVLTAVHYNEIPPREEGVHCEFCPYSWDCQPAKLTYKNRKFVTVRRPGGP